MKVCNYCKQPIDKYLILVEIYEEGNSPIEKEFCSIECLKAYVRELL